MKRVGEGDKVPVEILPQDGELGLDDKVHHDVVNVLGPGSTELVQVSVPQRHHRLLAPVQVSYLIDPEL